MKKLLSGRETNVVIPFLEDISVSKNNIAKRIISNYLRDLDIFENYSLHRSLKF